MEPWQSWAIAIVGAAAIYYYYFNHNKPRANRTRSASVSDAVPAPPKAPRRREESRPKPKAAPAKATGASVPQLNVESGEESFTTGGPEASKKRKASKKQTGPPSSAPSQGPAAKRQELDNHVPEREEDDNKAWAQQLASLKKGTSLAPPSRTDSRNRTVKQSAATFSSASSNAADADDDLTPAMSPTLAAGDVSDMMEPAASGPSVLRLTPSSNPAKAKKPQQQQAEFQAQESKKQRQNRKKVEERKLQREAEEKERQALLESQRRTAREARGEPARNGIPVSKPPSNNAWAEQTAARATEPPAVPVTANSAPLLDTFDGTAPSEEDQLKLAKQMSEDDSGWNTVPKGKKQKKKTHAAGSEDSNASDAGSVHNVVVEKPIAPSAPAPAPAYKPTSASVNGYSSLFDSGYDAGSHPEDSQWAA